MSAEPYTLEALFAALALPPGEAPRRVPKASLAENVPTAADRKLIDTKLVRLDWLAAINTASTGIPSGSADGLTVDTVNVLAARARGPIPPRLAEIIHRAIPKPVVLLHVDEASSMGAGISLAPKRAAEREMGRVVTTGLFDSGPLTEDEQAFAQSLALANLPTRDLAAVYAGLIARVEALEAARVAGRAFRLADGEAEQASWRAALSTRSELAAELARLSAAARKESRLATKVELGEKARQVKLRLDEAQVLLK